MTPPFDRWDRSPIWLGSWFTSLMLAIVVGTALAELLFGGLYGEERRSVLRVILREGLLLFGLLGSMWLARRGHWVGKLTWAGTLFGVVQAYLGCVPLVSLSWGSVLILALMVGGLFTFLGLVVDLMRWHSKPPPATRTPLRLAGVVLVGLALMNGVVAVSSLIGLGNVAVTIGLAEQAPYIATVVIASIWLVAGMMLLLRWPGADVLGPIMLVGASWYTTAVTGFIALDDLPPRDYSDPFALWLWAALTALVVVSTMLTLRGSRAPEPRQHAQAG